MIKALDGINVLEVCANLGAEYAAWILAEQGARTIKLEPPGGSSARGTPHFHVLNRSKNRYASTLCPQKADGRWKIYFAGLTLSSPDSLHQNSGYDGWTGSPFVKSVQEL